jgi:hypothetical protein
MGLPALLLSLTTRQRFIEHTGVSSKTALAPNRYRDCRPPNRYGDYQLRCFNLSLMQIAKGLKKSIEYKHSNQ